MANNDATASDSDDDLFDFVKQFRKLEKKVKQSKLEKQLKMNQLVNSQLLPSLQCAISKTEIASISNTNVKSEIIQSQIPNSSTTTTNNNTNNTSMNIQTTAINKRPGSCPSINNKKRLGDFGVTVGPVICIGDFDDGYDIPPLMSSTSLGKQKKNEDEDEYCYELLNRVINVGVYWRKSRVHRFPLRMFQSIESIYEHFAKLEDIEPSHVSLKLNKKSLSPTDSPHSMNYKVADFIDGDIEFYKSPYDPVENADVEEEQEEELTFRIKQQNVKRPVSISIKKSERMCILYLKLAEKLGLDVESFTLEFDGDVIQKSDTIETLDLEGDESFDLFKKKK